jgi:hypothetical protein
MLFTITWKFWSARIECYIDFWCRSQIININICKSKNISIRLLIIRKLLALPLKLRILLSESMKANSNILQTVIMCFHVKNICNILIMHYFNELQSTERDTTSDFQLLFVHCTYYLWAHEPTIYHELRESRIAQKRKKSCPILTSIGNYFHLPCFPMLHMTLMKL